eukprot:gnl/TRDRNA2_/TRDRNA2_38295_c0_seq1.p1 gnl/TRDRNA2_/TRDRNA2_38295_c0~~gnl/TRDRNA2_/TRDRNA2_38295_c0_seq1.p1  ORF type:complete len:379 (-),score=63.78 gnl/TRDRNA2_/TRDRNA2_38295_c0_seq1:127-1263(-)
MAHGQGWFGMMLVMTFALFTVAVGVSTQRGNTYLRRDANKTTVHNDSKRINISAPGDQGCPICKDPKHMGNLPPEVKHLSGVGPSHNHKGVLYVVPDASKDFRVYAISETGELLTTYKLMGIDLPGWACFGHECKGDLEALSIAPCTQGASDNCIFIADVGHSCMRKSEGCSDKRPYNMYSVMRFTEPKEMPKDGKTKQLDGVRFWFRFPEGDGPWDVGTLMANPKGEFFIVTKVEDGPSGVYKIPPFTSPKETVTVEKIAEVKRPTPGLKNGLISSEMFSGGSIRNGLGKMVDISLRTHSHIVHYSVSPLEYKNLTEVFEKQSPCVIGLSDDKPEGFTWDDHDGKTFYTISEGANSGIYKGECEMPRGRYDTKYGSV